MHRSWWRLCRPAERPRKVGTSIILVGVFALLALATRIFCLDPYQSSAFWPANGALVVAMLILPWRSCLTVLAACFCFNMFANMLTDYSTFNSWLYSVFNILVSCLVAVLTRRFCGATTDLTRFRRLASFGCIVFGSAALEAGIGEVLTSSGDTLAAHLYDWLQWTMCDGFGLLIATPAILLALKTRQSDYPCEAGPVERCCLIAATAGLTTVSFLFAHSPSFLLIYPLLILTALRAGPPWVLSAILMTAMISSGLTAHGYGPFAFIAASSKILLGRSMVQPFLISIFLTAVPANNALGEKARASRRLVRMKTIVEHTATHDGLTTLVNRDLFLRRLGAMLQSASPCAVLFIDLDRFKYINDTLGHGAGDELLRAFSGRVLEVTGADATVARFGGDEFAVLLPCGRGGASPEEVCRQITQVARQPFLLAKGPAHVSASVGLAVASGLGADAGELMRKADIALYAVKAAGRDGYRIFSDALDRLVRDKADIETDLRQALHEGGQLELHYQSKVDTHGVVRGVEALLRWSHPSRGMVPPNVAIEVAEETGLIIPLGDWVMREALAFAARWPQLNVSVNVSPMQLRHPRFVAETLKAYGHAQLSYGRLEMEVTETALMDDLNLASVNLAALRAAGIRIALDDFGTGYSSLRHLHRCAVDRVKIDQSFVSGLDASHEAAAITRAVIQLGHAMGLQVTAEGVETETQRRFLLEAGVDALQGFLFSKPLDERGFAAMMRAQKPQGPGAAFPEYVLIRGGLG